MIRNVAPIIGVVFGLAAINIAAFAIFLGVLAIGNAVPWLAGFAEFTIRTAAWLVTAGFVIALWNARKLL